RRLGHGRGAGLQPGDAEGRRLRRVLRHLVGGRRGQRPRRARSRRQRRVGRRRPDCARRDRRSNTVASARRRDGVHPVAPRRGRALLENERGARLRAPLRTSLRTELYRLSAETRTVFTEAFSFRTLTSVFVFTVLMTWPITAPFLPTSVMLTFAVLAV